MALDLADPALAIAAAWTDAIAAARNGRPDELQALLVERVPVECRADVAAILASALPRRKRRGKVSQEWQERIRRMYETVLGWPEMRNKALARDLLATSILACDALGRPVAMSPELIRDIVEKRKSYADTTSARARAGSSKRKLPNS